MRHVTGYWLRHRAQAGWLVAVIALAVAVATTAWSIAHGLWLERPLYTEPDRLVSVGWTAPEYAGRNSRTSVDEFVDLKAATGDFLELAGTERVASWYLRRPDRLTVVVTAYATTNLFDLLGVPPMRGRTFEPSDAEAIAGVPRAVITDRLWRRKFQADAAIVGQLVTVSADREARTVEIVGVIPNRASVYGGRSGPVDLFIAMPDGRRPDGSTSRRVYDRSVIGRLHPGVSAAQAGARLTPLLQQIDREHPLFERVRSADVVSLQELLGF